jgi:hypothetical protein
MPFFMNVFDFEFRGSLLSADRQYQQTFKVKANTNRSDYMLSGNAEPYNFSSETDLTLSFCYDLEQVNYANVTIDISGSTAAATTAAEVVTALNADNLFSTFFTASVFKTNTVGVTENKVLIKSKKPKSNFKAYIVNSGAEGFIKFNKLAPIQELPTYFTRYDIDERFNYTDLGSERILLLDTSNPIEADYIDAAGFDHSNPSPDWQLLKGCNDQYMFTKRVYTSGFISTEIKYPAGASIGDAAFKTTYEYSGSDLIGVCQIPYIISSGDLITPPV